MAKDKAYLATLDRFGYDITAVGRTEKEARDAVMDSYKDAYVHENGTDPAKDRYPGSKESYLHLAETELCIEELPYGKAIWR